VETAALPPPAFESLRPDTAVTRYERLHRTSFNVDEDSIRNVILFIGDGLGMTQLSTALALNHGAGSQTALTLMPVTGVARTFSSNNLVTDSGAGATALATGFKTINKGISMTPERIVVKTLLEALRGEEKRVGLITTSYLVDATPAAFTAHVPHRDDYKAIAEQMITVGADLLVGGDGDTFPPESVAAAEAQGYAVVRSPQALAALPDGTPTLALWSEREDAISTYGPPLQGLVRRAIDHLRPHPQGFLLIVEQEQTDVAGHSNRLDLLTRGVAELEEAVEVALDFAEAEGGTLVLVTADHDSGGINVVEAPFAEQEAEVRWTTFRHTAQWVPVFAAGPGALAYTGVLDNTEVPRILARQMNLTDFPTRISETVEEAIEEAVE
jgi:alkaline phosphatase